MSEEVGQRIGPFEIKGLLGKGGMARVYRARQTSLNRDVAVKVIDADLTGQPGFLERFQREIDIIKNLEHPHVLPVYEAGTSDGGQVYLAMRLIDGGSLSDRTKSGKLDTRQALRYISQIANALDFAHRREIVHRDLKPGNILLDEAGNAYLTDFGIAKMLEAQVDLTGTNETLGTPAYMAPEQVLGTKVDGRTDVYALGVLAFECLTGRRPFDGSIFTVIQKQLNEAPPSAPELNPELPAAVDGVLKKAMAKDPLARFQTAGEFASALEGALNNTATFVPPVSESQPEADSTLNWQGESASLETRAPATNVQPEPASVNPRKGRWAVAAFVLFALAVVGGGAWWASRSTSLPVPLAMALATADGNSLQLLGRDGTPSRMLQGGRAGWSPDGRRLLLDQWYADGQKGNEVAELDILSGERRNLSNHPAMDFWGNYSPDGEWIVFHSNRGGTFNLWRVRRDGTGLECLEESPHNNQWASWSPDGERIAFTSDREGQRDIYVLELETRRVQRLTVSTSPDEFAVWSPDSAALAFTSGQSGSSDVWTVNLDGSNLRQLTQNQGNDRFPSWAPADKIAFVSDRNGAWNVFTINPDGSDERQLEGLSAPLGSKWGPYPTWGPEAAFELLD